MENSDSASVDLVAVRLTRIFALADITSISPSCPDLMVYYCIFVWGRPQSLPDVFLEFVINTLYNKSMRSAISRSDAWSVAQTVV